MANLKLIIGVVIGGVWAGTASAGAQCEGPTRTGNTWNLVCAADGSEETDYQCDYVISLTNADGLTETVEASGSVPQGKSGLILWSGIQSDGADIVSAEIVSGDCRF